MPGEIEGRVSWASQRNRYGRERNKAAAPRLTRASLMLAARLPRILGPLEPAEPSGIR